MARRRHAYLAATLLEGIGANDLGWTESEGESISEEKKDEDGDDQGVLVVDDKERSQEQPAADEEGEQFMHIFGIKKLHKQHIEYKFPDAMDPSLMTPSQKKVYDLFLAAMDSRKQAVYFLTGGEGTGKSALTKAIVHAAQQKGLNVAITASSGIAAHLMRGSTVHSMFGLMRNCDDSFDLGNQAVWRPRCNAAILVYRRTS